MGRKISVDCLLCWNSDEDHGHLFFECPYFKAVSGAVLHKCGYNTIIIGP
jgi:hypothetical protein